MKIQRLKKLAKNAIGYTRDDDRIAKWKSIDTLSEDEAKDVLMEIITFYVIDEIEFGGGDWEEPDEIIYDLGASESEAKEIMDELPEYFGEEEFEE